MTQLIDWVGDLSKSLIKGLFSARMAELADAGDLKSLVRKDVRVQIPLRVPISMGLSMSVKGSLRSHSSMAEQRAVNPCI